MIEVETRRSAASSRCSAAGPRTTRSSIGEPEGRQDGIIAEGPAPANRVRRDAPEAARQAGGGVDLGAMVAGAGTAASFDETPAPKAVLGRGRRRRSGGSSCLLSTSCTPSSGPARWREPWTRQPAEADADLRRVARHRRHHLSTSTARTSRRDAALRASIPSPIVVDQPSSRTPSASCAACANGNEAPWRADHRLRAGLRRVLSDRYISERFRPTRRRPGRRGRAPSSGWRGLDAAELDERSIGAGCSSRSSARRCASEHGTPPRRRPRYSRKSWPDLRERGDRHEGRSGEREKEVVAGTRETREQLEKLSPRRSRRPNAPPTTPRPPS